MQKQYYIMDQNVIDKNRKTTDKFSVRMSFIAWIICAILGWTIAVTSFNSIIGDNDVPITAQKEPSLEDAAKMEQVLPAAGQVK